MVSIRPEATEDRDVIRALTIAAFSNSEFGHNGEAELIDTLRECCPDRLSLVACAGDEVVGHILFTPVTIRTANGDIDGMGLAPMSVLPDRQKRGIGSSLVQAGLAYLFDNATPFVVVLGHPEYYSRFGFQPASQFGISHGFSGLPQDVFFVRVQRDQSLDDFAGGRAYYSSVFGPQHEDA